MKSSFKVGLFWYQIVYCSGYFILNIINIRLNFVLFYIINVNVCFLRLFANSLTNGTLYYQKPRYYGYFLRISHNNLKYIKKCLSLSSLYNIILLNIKSKASLFKLICLRRKTWSNFALSIISQANITRSELD